MSRRRPQPARELDFEPEGPEPISGTRQEGWAEVERSIVKAALSSGVNRCLDLSLRPEELSDRRARSVWAAVLRRIEAGARSVWFDGVLIAEVTKEVPIEVARDCVAWCKAAADETEDEAVEALVSRVRDRVYSARVYALAARLRETAEPGTPAAAARAAMVISELRDLTEVRGAPSSAVEMVSVSQAFEDWLEEVEARRKSRAPMPSLGLDFVDERTIRSPGKVTGVVAESHTGKTGLIACAALRSARKGLPAAFITIDDPWRQIVARIAAEAGGFNTMEVTGQQTALDLPERLAKARAELRGLPVHGFDIRDRTIDSVNAAIRMAASRGCKLAAVDHWNAIRRPRGMVRLDGADEILGSVMATAAERGVHLIIAAQPNREKGRKEVTKHDVRDTQTLFDSSENFLGLEACEKKQVRVRILKAKETDGAGKSIVLQRNAYGVLQEPDEAAAF